MLQRKQSLIRNELCSQNTAVGTIILGDFATNATEDSSTNRNSPKFMRHKKEWLQRLIKVFSLLSFVSICANTPETIGNSLVLLYTIFIVDLLCSIVFTIEMSVKMKQKGLLKHENSYAFDRWSQFDFMLVMAHWISVAIQIVQVTHKPLNASYLAYLSILRCPRPLILVRLIRAFIKFRLPKNRIRSILQRSSSQIYNVTIFFLFFMALYGIVGVQFFGELTNHCVKNNTSFNETPIFYLNNLMIPDTYCSNSGDGYKCPEGFKCVEVSVSRGDRGYNGFDELITSIFTVYEAASQEGWVALMYRATDSLPSWRALLYFITMIFFLAWLVKNVFIAVIIETFAEIRVQFQQMWGVRGKEASLEQTKIFERLGNGQLKLIVKNENKYDGLAPEFCLKIYQSSLFNMSILGLVLANAIITANMRYSHDETIDNQVRHNYYVIEWVFTMLFNLECLFKIFCLGFRSYIRRNIHKFEFILVIGTSLRLAPSLYLTEMTYFQVLRIVRLIKSSPLLEDFTNKIFGPGKKLGSLIIFTMCLLLITSCVSMQLFCSLTSDKYKKFETFSQALMSQFSIMTSEGWSDHMYDTMIASHEQSLHKFYIYFVAIYFILIHMFCTLAFMTMFQILTQKGWHDIMHSTMRQAHKLSPLVAIYFISYHLFVTLIVLSLFVAVILDNLELEEDVKKIKQLKMREQSAETQKNLPWRLRVFEKFSSHPQMVSLNKKLPNEFDVPKIRESFMKQFLGDDYYAGFDSQVTSDTSPLKNHTTSSDNALTRRISIVHKLKAKSSMRKSIVQNGPRLSRVNEHASANQVATKRSLFSIDENSYDTLNKNTKLLNGKRQNESSKPRARNRLSMKKVALIKLVKNSNSQRLVTSTPVTINETHKKVPIITLNDQSRKQQLTSNGDVNFKLLQYRRQQAEMKRNQMEDDLKENHPNFDKPLFTIGRESTLRKFCKLVVESKWSTQTNGSAKKGFRYKLNKFLGLVSYLDWLMIFITITSCISMTFESPQKRIVDYWELKVADYLFVITMSIELTLKICAYGVIFTPNAIVKDFCGIIDLFIYFTSLLFLIIMPKYVPQNSLAQMLLLLRCLRPLRIFILVPHMRKVIYELCRGFKEILMVSVLLVVLTFIFANYGIQIYGGRLARCNDQSIRTRAHCVGLFKRHIAVSKLRLPLEPNRTQPGIWVKRVWANPYNINFDTIGNSMLTLFEVLSLEGWLDVRDVIIDRMTARHAIFVHVFVFIGTLIGLTLFVGVVITNYSENKGTALLTVDQRRWLDLKGRIKLAQPLHIPPRPENSRFRAFMFDITQNNNFKRLSAFCVLVNCGLLSVPWKPNDSTTNVLAGLACLFSILFLVEAFMKTVALGFYGYWQSRRNRFDLFATLMAIVWMILHLVSIFKTHLQSSSHSIGFAVIVLRFFTVAGKHATLKMLMLTIIVSFFKSFFIIIGMFLLMLVYAFSGVILFGSVKWGHDLTRHANFRSVPNAIILLMRIVTGEEWNKIMHDCMIAPPACTKASNYWESDCGNFTAAFLYFCSFYVIITYIVLNLLVAIIMENFSLFYSNEEDALLSYNDIRNFQIVWNIIDIDRKGIIPCKRVKYLLRLLNGRLEVDFEKDVFLFKHMCYEIEKLHSGGDVTFHDVLNMLSYRSVDIRKSLKLEELIQREELEYQIEEEVAKLTIRSWLIKCVRKMREKGHLSSHKQLTQKQNDLALFKEQMGARQQLIQTSHSQTSRISQSNSTLKPIISHNQTPLTSDYNLRVDSIHNSNEDVTNTSNLKRASKSTKKSKRSEIANENDKITQNKRDYLQNESLLASNSIKNWWNITINDTK